MTAIAPLTVRQLIYTNVAPELSPTKQGGFQVWRYSAKLGTPNDRMAIAQRLGDFKLPRVTFDPKSPDPKPDLMAVRRYQAYPVAGVGYVIARAVPLAEKDEFGRGGRFFAHALVLTDAEFEEIDFDPFRVLGPDPFREDGDGFRFWSEPAEGLPAPPERPAGTRPAPPARPLAILEDAVVTPVGYTDSPRLPDEYRSALLAYLAGENPKTVVWPAQPAVVFQVARAVVRSLPVVARRRFAFDTLSTGAGLDKIRYSLVGGFSADVARAWSFHECSLFEAKTNDFQPPLPKVQDLPGTLLGAPGWATLTDAERTRLYETGDALARQDMSRLTAAGELPPAAAEVLEQVRGREIVVALLDTKESKEIPAVLAKLPAVREKLTPLTQGSLPELLDRLPHPIDRGRVNEGLYEEFRSTTRPADEVVESVVRWLGPDASPHLRLRVARWRLTDSNLDWLLRTLDANEGKQDSKVINWLRETLPFTAKQVVDETKVLASPTAARLQEFRLWLALNRTPADAEWVSASFQVAYHCGAKSASSLGDVFELLHADAESRDHALRRQAQIISEIGFECATPGWVRQHDKRWLGLIARIHPDHIDRVTVLFTKGMGDRLAVPIIDGWRAPRGLPARKPEQPVIASKTTIARLCEQMLGSDCPEPVLEGLRDKLHAAVLDADVWERQHALWQLHNRAQGIPVVLELDRGILFAGVQVRWREHTLRTGYLYLFEALAGLIGRKFGDTADGTARPAAYDEPAAKNWMFGLLYDALVTPAR